MKIYLVRHAETESNYSGLMQGRSNVGLNDTGMRQVNRLRETVKDLDLDICYCSPLIRTMQTAMGLVGERVLIEKDERLIERNLGEFEGQSFENYNAVLYWNFDKNYTAYGVEGIQDIFKRCEDFLNEILTKKENQSILIVSHSAVIRAIHFLLGKDDLKNPLSFKIPNCYFEEIEIDTEKRVL